MRTRFISLFVFLSLCAATAFPGVDMARVKRVTSGNTFVVDRNGTEETIRLLGVITPDPSDKKAEVSSFGKFATEYLGGLLPAGEWVSLEKDPSRPPKDGITDAYVYRSRGAIFVNEKIVVEGYGIAHTKTKFAYADVLAAAEKKAKMVRKGLWGDAPEKAARYAGTGQQPTYAGVAAGDGGDSGWVTVWIITVW